MNKQTLKRFFSQKLRNWRTKQFQKCHFSKAKNTEIFNTRNYHNYDLQQSENGSWNKNYQTKEDKEEPKGKARDMISR